MKKISFLLAIFILGATTLLTAQSKLGIGVNGSYLSPTGDFGDVYKAGAGGGASLTYAVTNNLQLSANVGYSQLSFNNDKYNQLLNSFFGSFGTAINVNVDSKLKVIPIVLGGKYFLTSTNFRPYATVDVGLHIISADEATVKVNGQTLTAAASESKTATAWGLGAGFLIKAAPKINVDINAKINGNNLEVGTSMSASSGGSSSSQSSNSTMTFFSVSAGLIFEL